MDFRDQDRGRDTAGMADREQQASGKQPVAVGTMGRHHRRRPRHHRQEDGIPDIPADPRRYARRPSRTRRVDAAIPDESPRLRRRVEPPPGDRSVDEGEPEARNLHQGGRHPRRPHEDRREPFRHPDRTSGRRVAAGAHRLHGDRKERLLQAIRLPGKAETIRSLPGARRKHPGAPRGLGGDRYRADERRLCATRYPVQVRIHRRERDHLPRVSGASRQHRDIRRRKQRGGRASRGRVARKANDVLLGRPRHRRIPDSAGPARGLPGSPIDPDG